jgi:hypothetical protein
MQAQDAGGRDGAAGRAAVSAGRPAMVLSTALPAAEDGTAGALAAEARAAQARATPEQGAGSQVRAKPAAAPPLEASATGSRPAGIRPAGDRSAAILSPARLPPWAPQPFRSAEDAWLWTMAALRARRDGARYTANRGLISRPCEPDDVVRCLDALYRDRVIDLRHARVLRIWGERQAAPDPVHATERGDSRLWREALARLDWPLREKGIVA